MLSERNICYVLNKIDRDRFAGIISGHMEPQLISIVVKQLGELGNLIIVENKAWEKGEFDILVYSELENVVLHIQAKAAIPVQGARMIRANEDRINEGLHQLKVFREEPQTIKDTILSRALGLDVRNAVVIDCILSRSSFGTNSIWSKMGDAIPLSPMILNHLLKKYIGSSEEFLLTQFKNHVDDFFEYILAEMEPIWSENKLDISDKEVFFPLLEYDINKLSRLRDELWKYFPISEEAVTI